MTAIKVLSETAISIYDLKKEIERIKKRDHELNYRANKTEDYLNNITPSELAKKADSVYASISKLNIARLKEAQIKKLIDIWPKTAKEVKAVLQSYTISLTNEQIQKITDVFLVSLPHP